MKRFLFSCLSFCVAAVWIAESADFVTSGLDLSSPIVFGGNVTFNGTFITTSSGTSAFLNAPIVMNSSKPIGWSGTTDNTADVILLRDGAANTLAQRNGTNAQTFNVYGTFTDTSNYRRLKSTMTTGGAVTIDAGGLGTGVAGNTMALGSNGTVAITLSSANATVAGQASFSVTNGGATITGGTIAATTSTNRVQPAGAITGVIVAAGTTDGQQLTIINESAAVNTITMAAAATSNVADGTSTVIAGLTSASFVWGATSARWFHNR